MTARFEKGDLIRARDNWLAPFAPGVVVVFDRYYHGFVVVKGIHAAFEPGGFEAVPDPFTIASTGMVETTGDGATYRLGGSVEEE